MEQLGEAIAIAIIGGADGPTSIYISKQSLWMIIIETIIILALSVLVICGFVRNIKRRKIIKSLIYGIIIFAAFLFVTISAAIRHKNYKEKLRETIELYENPGQTENSTDQGIYTEAEDFEYFRKNNKLINIEDDRISQ